MSPTLLITGGTGYLGHHLIHAAQSWTTHATYFRTSPPAASRAQFHQCDVSKNDQVHDLITSIKPDVIIHTACSNKSAEEIEAIVPAARHLSTIAHQHSLAFLHLSTDLIFDGTCAPYRETDLPNPLHPYGKAKTEAEHIVTQQCPTATIIRSSLMYGIDPLDHQTRWLLRGMDTEKPIRLFTDERRSPIWVHTLVAALLELSTLNFQGILHLAGPETLNRWEFGHAILHLVGRKTTANIHASTIDESGLIRPKDLAFSIETAKQLLNTPFLSIAEVTNQLRKGSS
ncbi:MAG: NAD(P)-dependent oxidoreductase [Nitrospirales bacterium]|nr:MAG: NAD(P)-dependent oxidoreductase [Nitrospirales bacterium]